MTSSQVLGGVVVVLVGGVVVALHAGQLGARGERRGAVAGLGAGQGVVERDRDRVHRCRRSKDVEDLAAGG